MGTWIVAKTCDCADCTGPTTPCSNVTKCDCSLSASSFGDDTNFDQTYNLRTDGGALVRASTLTVSYSLDPDGDNSSRGQIQIYVGASLAFDSGCSGANSSYVGALAIGDTTVRIVVTSGCGLPTYDTDWSFAASCTP